MEASPMLVDVHDAPVLLKPLQQSIPAEKAALNTKGYLDVMWITEHIITIERKTTFDLVSSIVDGSLETRLRLGLEHAEECGLLVEGVMTPSPKGGSVCWSLAKNGKIMFPRRTFQTHYVEILSFLYRLDKLGVSVYFTSSLAGTTTALVGFYKNSMKDEHTTFNRYIRQKPILMDKDPYVESLMGVAGIGEWTAKKLLEEFHTPFEVLVQTSKDLARVDGVGVKTAENILRRIGRL